MLAYQNAYRSQIGDEQDGLPVALQLLGLPVDLDVFLVGCSDSLLEIVFESSGGEVESHSDDAEEAEEYQLHCDADFCDGFAFVGLFLCVWCVEIYAGDLDCSHGLEEEGNCCIGLVFVLCRWVRCTH